jgi:hypothetical protein
MSSVLRFFMDFMDVPQCFSECMYWNGRHRENTERPRRPRLAGVSDVQRAQERQSARDPPARSRLPIFLLNGKLLSVRKIIRAWFQPRLPDQVSSSSSSSTIDDSSTDDFDLYSTGFDGSPGQVFPPAESVCYSSFLHRDDGDEAQPQDHRRSGNPLGDSSPWTLPLGCSHDPTATTVRDNGPEHTSDPPSAAKPKSQRRKQYMCSDSSCVNPFHGEEH